MSEIGDRPNYDYGPRRGETEAKNWTSRNSASELKNPLEMVKKTIYAFKSLNSDVWARA